MHLIENTWLKWQECWLRNQHKKATKAEIKLNVGFVFLYFGLTVVNQGNILQGEKVRI